MTTKETARKIANENVKTLTREQRDWASGCIADAISGVREFCLAHNLFVFLGTENEPNTEEIVGLGLMLERTVSVPRVEKDGMHAVVISPFTNFKRTKFGILEPVGGHDITDVDVAVVPIVAFDSLNRAGHGAGYYDKFLSAHDCFKIGIAFDCQEVKDLEVTDLDVPLDMIITEKRIIFADKVQKNPFGE